MADDEVEQTMDETVSETKQTASARPSKSPRTKRSGSGKAAVAATNMGKSKTRGLSDDEKLELIREIEAQVGNGVTLKDAVKAIGISDQTYYVWKKALSQTTSSNTASTVEAPAVSGDDEIAEFVELEQENRRLRKLLSEKLRAENADLRKRLGM